MEVGPPKYNQGDYVRIDFGSGHVKAMINRVKRNRNHDRAIRNGEASRLWWMKRNPNGWFYEVAKHYSTGTEDIPDLRYDHWSPNPRLVIGEGEIQKLIPCPNDFKLKYLVQGMTNETEQLIRSNL